MKKTIFLFMLAAIVTSAVYAQQPSAVPAEMNQKISAVVNGYAKDILGTKLICTPASVYLTVTAGQELERKARYYGSMVNALLDIKQKENEKTLSDIASIRWQKAYDRSIAAYKALTNLKHMPGFNPDAIHYTLYKTSASVKDKARDVYVAWDNQFNKAMYVCIDEVGIRWMSEYTQVPDDFDIMDLIATKFTREE